MVARVCKHFTAFIALFSSTLLALPVNITSQGISMPSASSLFLAFSHLSTNFSTMPHVVRSSTVLRSPLEGISHVAGITITNFMYSN